ncbi:sensor histidine kinase [Pelagerythrobacter marensis]|uniref:histidine kinase n=1 Tax=Pelagerythrobacter marensis TaxID=543877 RepID=A0A0G3XD70_9SPHN|nr:ATP-binding protein [Pelagerythrobacter marensis]AKM08519.1 Putative two-component histidine kinase [Pelagerythrobacter marensis]
MRLSMRLWPRSLMGQMLLAVAVVLLLAQAISAGLLWRAAEARREAAVMNAAAFSLVVRSQPREERGDRRPRAMERGDAERWVRALRIERVPAFAPLPGDVEDADRTATLRSLVESHGMVVDDMIVVERPLARDPYVDGRPRLRARLLRSNGPDRRLVVAALRQPGEDHWVVARVPLPSPQRGVLGSILVQTLVIYALLVGLHFLLLRRITGPLAALTTRTEKFARTQNADGQLEPRGPHDVRRLISAHNAMEARIAALLDEKDVMLGAIGHDLKTPLAALRVRIESVEDESERQKMAAGIEDITRSLDDILSLARVGRASEPPERVDLAALTAAVVEEFEDMGDPVTLGPTVRTALPVYITWLRRGLRNLIANAVRYGGEAEVSLLREGERVILRVDDRGPGIAPDRIADMLEPFTRGEASRNRATGGAGLGLTLARAIAEQHDGELVLANREEGGLRGEIRLPTG